MNRRGSMPRVCSRWIILRTDMKQETFKPAFLITIDTEEDYGWARGIPCTTRNVAFLPRFQELCERYDFKPTWLTNYPVAQNPLFVEFGNDLLRRETGEIGMHLHAWNTPPEYSVSENDADYKPYLYEYPVDIMRDKIDRMTSLLEEKFQRPILSHRAGRWGFNEQYAQLLIERGYQVDCSVTPYESWQFSKGIPGGKTGPDFREFPSQAYFCNPNNIQRCQQDGLLELPMTIIPRRPVLRKFFPESLTRYKNGRRLLKLIAPCQWLRPTRYRRAGQLIDVVKTALEQKRDYIEFMLHSSELMPGGSPTFPTDSSIEQLYDDLEQLFEFIQNHYHGETLTGYSHKLNRSHKQTLESVTA